MTNAARLYRQELRALRAMSNFIERHPRITNAFLVLTYTLGTFAALVY